MSEADDPTPQIETPKSRPTHSRLPVVMGSVATILALMASGISGYVLLNPSPTPTAVPNVRQDPAIAQLQQKLDALASQSQDTTKLAALQANITQLQARIVQLEAKLETQIVKPNIDTAPLTSRLEALETAARKSPVEALPRETKLVALHAFELAFEARKPFAGQLKALQGAFGIETVDAQLLAAAEKGLPTADVLLAELTAKKTAVSAMLAPPPADLWEAFTQKIARWVVIEKNGASLTSATGTLDQMERALKAGHWHKLPVLWQKLSIPAQETLPILKSAIAAQIAGDALIHSSWRDVPSKPPAKNLSVPQ